jgi:ribulose-5-phosphate 4-epimerase/fuculose-1-phosphate aldolase
VGASLHSRGYTHGATGNLSVRLEDGFLMTPTGVRLDELRPDRLSRLDVHGRLESGEPATKEAGLHLAMYRSRPRAQAVVHLHGTDSVALSLLPDLDPEDALPPYTAYYVMRVGRLTLLPYFPPGDAALAQAVGEAARHTHAVLLAHHGPVLAGTSLDAAADAAEELEQTARIHLRVHGRGCRCLSSAERAELVRRFPHQA